MGDPSEYEGQMISLRPGILAATDFTVSRARVEDFMAWLEK